MRAEHAPEERLVTPISWATLSVHVVASPGSHGALEVGGLMAGGATVACAPRRARRDPDIHSEALGTGFVPIWWQSCVVPAALLLGVVSIQRHLERLQRASRASPVGLGEGFASPGLGPKRLQGRLLWMRCSPQQTLSIRARALRTVKQLKPGQPRLL